MTGIVLAPNSYATMPNSPGRLNTGGLSFAPLMAPSATDGGTVVMKFEKVPLSLSVHPLPKATKPAASSSVSGDLTLGGTIKLGSTGNALTNGHFRLSAPSPQFDVSLNEFSGSLNGQVHSNEDKSLRVSMALTQSSPRQYTLHVAFDVTHKDADGTARTVKPIPSPGHMVDKDSVVTGHNDSNTIELTVSLHHVGALPTSGSY